ncbi:MAG TPA: hypothetical protein VM866_04475 [Pyrinomonadaceae bacterium]|nr:hypothetical protein [Pyrinomonadaceae bacterium]
MSLREDDMEAFVRVYRRILEEQAIKQKIITDTDDLRAVQIFTQKELMRASFLSNPLATEEDFERLWPRLFDEMLCLQAHDVHRQVMDALIAQLDREERQ